MKGGKIFYLLKLLTPEEFKGLKKAICSPLLNTNERLLFLYEALRPAYPDYDNSEKYQKKIFKKVFQKEPYHYGKLHKLFSAFCRVLEEYLLFLEIQKEGPTRQKIALQLYGNRQMNDYLEQQKERILHRLKKQPFQDAAFWLEQFQTLEFYYSCNQGTPMQEAFSASTKMMDVLDQFYFSQKLKLSCTIKSSQKFLKEAYHINLLEAIQTEVTKNANTTNHQINIFQRLIQLFETENITIYQQIKNLFFKKKATLSYADNQYVFRYLLNFTIHQINKGDRKFIKENFELNKKGIEEGWLLENGQIPAFVFINLVFNATNLKAFDWTNNFIEEYITLVETSIRQDVKKLSLAYYFYFKNDYEKVIHQLIQYPFTNSLILLRVKSLLLRTYFELVQQDTSYGELFFAYCLSFEQFLRRNNTYNQKRIKPYLNFILFLKKLGKYIINRKIKQATKEDFLQAVEDNPVIFKSWLIDKIKYS